MKTAILVDGGFYRRRAQIKIGEKSAIERANELDNYCKRHLTERIGKDKKTTHELYRIFYYDCPPMNKKIRHPFTDVEIDFGKSELNIWMTLFCDELKKHRKFALRHGKLSDTQACYNIPPNVTKKLCRGK